MLKITLKEALAEMRKLDEMGHSFNITFCTYNENLQKGGERKTYKNVRLSKQENEMPSEINVLSKNYNKKNPNHNKNLTINIIKENGEPRTVHIYLIEFFNNKEILQ